MQTSQSAVARLESGRHVAQLSTLARYAEALGLSLDLAEGAGTLAGDSGADRRAEAARTPSKRQVSLKQPQQAEIPHAEAARATGRPGRKPKADVPAVTLQASDRPDPDHVLTSRQRQVLKVIGDSMAKSGHPPSLREIGEAVGLTSTSSVSHQLRTLQRAGYLHRDVGRPRTVEVRLHTAVLRVRSGTCFGLLRHAVSVRANAGAVGPGWDLVKTRFPDMGAFAQLAASFGPDVVVLDPPDLREAVIARLKGAGLEDRPAMSRPVAELAAAAGEAAAVSAQIAAPVDMADSDGAEEIAAHLRAALAAGRRVHLLYYSPRSDEVTERDVDPMRLLEKDGLLYLEAWCRRAEDVRTFRLDRVLALEVLDVPASPPANAAHVDVDHGLFQPSPGDVPVVLELSAPGRWVAGYYRCEAVSDLEDGRLRVTLRTPDTGWVRRLALGLGEDGQVVSPSSLAAEIRDAVTAALANYDSLPECRAGLLEGQDPDEARR
jgi:predicted DNA-binding transcriptional regulator YafY